MVFEERRISVSEGDCAPSWQGNRTKVSKESTTDAVKKNREGQGRQHLTWFPTHLDVKVLWVVENGADVFSLRLHVYLLYLAVLEWRIAVAGCLDLILRKSSVQCRFGGLEGVCGECRSRSHVERVFEEIL